MRNPPSTDLFHSSTRNRQGALGREVVGYIGGKLGDYQIRVVAQHFNRDPVVISQGIKRMEDKLDEGKGFSLEMDPKGAREVTAKIVLTELRQGLGTKSSPTDANQGFS